MLALCVLWGCSEVEDEVVNSQLSLDKEQMEFPYAGGDITLSIVNNTDWGISDLPEWLSASAVNGIRNSSVTISAQPNAEDDDRTGHFFVFTHDNKNKIEITIKQEGTHSSPLIIDDNSERIFGGLESTSYEYSFAISCDTHWTIEGPSWITAAFNDKNISLDGTGIYEGAGVVSLAVNQRYGGNTARTDTLLLKTMSGESVAKIPVCQLGKNEIRVFSELTLSDGYACQFKYGSNVSRFVAAIYEGVAPQDALTSSSINENNDIWLLGSAKNTTLFYKSYLKSETEYTIYCRGINSSNIFAPIESIGQHKIHTPTDKNQPMAYISEPVYSDNRWFLPIHPNEYAASYIWTVYGDTFEKWDINELKIYLAYNWLVLKGIASFGDSDSYNEINLPFDVTFVSRARRRNGEMSNTIDIHISHQYSNSSSQEKMNTPPVKRKSSGFIDLSDIRTIPHSQSNVKLIK